MEVAKRSCCENFLQQHYNKYRDSSGDHASYIVFNDLTTQISLDLRVGYERHLKEHLMEVETPTAKVERLQNELRAVQEELCSGYVMSADASNACGTCRRSFWAHSVDGVSVVRGPAPRIVCPFDDTQLNITMTPGNEDRGWSFSMACPKCRRAWYHNAIKELR